MLTLISYTSIVSSPLFIDLCRTQLPDHQGPLKPTLWFRWLHNVSTLLEHVLSVSYSVPGMFGHSFTEKKNTAKRIAAVAASTMQHYDIDPAAPRETVFVDTDVVFDEAFFYSGYSFF